MNFSRPRIIAVAAIAFFGGVLFASSMDWTKLLVAQARPGAPIVSIAAPGAGDVQGGFVGVAEKVTPAVVSISAERDARPSANRNQNNPHRPQNLQKSARHTRRALLFLHLLLNARINRQRARSKPLHKIIA